MTYTDIFKKFCDTFNFKTEITETNVTFLGDEKHMYSIDVYVETDSPSWLCDEKRFKKISFVGREGKSQIPSSLPEPFSLGVTHFVFRGQTYYSSTSLEDAVRNFMTEMSGNVIGIPGDLYSDGQEKKFEFPKFSSIQELAMNLNLSFGMEFNKEEDGKTC